MVKFDKALDTIMKLDSSSREMLIEILKKRQIEERRKEIEQNAKSAIALFKKGKLKSHTAKEILRELNN